MRLALLFCVVSTVACTADFDQFEPAVTGDGGTTTDGSGVDSGPPACTEAEAKQLGGHCYFPISSVRWNQASSSCTAKGAHLVTITSIAEETLVEGIRSGNDRWLGLSRSPSAPPTAASFKWVTGEAVSFTKWGSGEPNGTGECARLSGSNSWADDSCNQSFDAICERE